MMLKNLILVPIITLFGFVNLDTTPVTSSEATISKEVLKEIETFNQIIEIKLEQATALDRQSDVLFAQNPNSKEAQDLKEEAQLYRMMTLKYQAAIACRKR